ncbi:hypothetical protein NEMIN01_1581 [Nematocida minor]|uniref:uncharacterized protein n=1 Tax=Nematocida minor TaxID=1912983 RepID=UPI00221F8014|nr:uncharacterized protein NEMIN01_1581 [Nematocida minor]KAI5191597.1 hypothetical protein NEMIN01_1581 [Nematocida minor]
MKDKRAPIEITFDIQGINKNLKKRKEACSNVDLYNMDSIVVYSILDNNIHLEANGLTEKERESLLEIAKRVVYIHLIESERAEAAILYNSLLRNETEELDESDVVELTKYGVETRSRRYVNTLRSEIAIFMNYFNWCVSNIVDVKKEDFLEFAKEFFRQETYSDVLNDSKIQASISRIVNNKDGCVNSNDNMYSLHELYKNCKKDILLVDYAMMYAFNEKDKLDELRQKVQDTFCTGNSTEINRKIVTDEDISPDDMKAIKSLNRFKNSIYSEKMFLSSLIYFPDECFNHIVRTASASMQPHAIPDLTTQYSGSEVFKATVDVHLLYAIFKGENRKVREKLFKAINFHNEKIRSIENSIEEHKKIREDIDEKIEKLNDDLEKEETNKSNAVNQEDTNEDTCDGDRSVIKHSIRKLFFEKNLIREYIHKKLKEISRYSESKHAFEMSLLAIDEYLPNLAGVQVEYIQKTVIKYSKILGVDLQSVLKEYETEHYQPNRLSSPEIIRESKISPTAIPETESNKAEETNLLASPQTDVSTRSLLINRIVGYNRPMVIILVVVLAVFTIQSVRTSNYLLIDV